MTIRPMKHALLPLLALGMTLAVAVSAHADNRYYKVTNGAPATMQVNFGTAPHWTAINGTRVQEIRVGDRPSYDMFRYGGRYYAFNNDQWYSSRRSTGLFNAMDPRNVPVAFNTVTREHWRSYPDVWIENRQSPGNSAFGHAQGKAHQKGNGRGK